MAEIVYIVCAIAALACAGLLARSWWKSRSRLLLWSSICFFGLAANSIIVLVDLMVLTQHDLRPLRLAVAATGLLLLMCELVTRGD